MKEAPPPRRDSRYRVHRSALIYGLNAYFVDGDLTLSFQESMERVVYLSPSGREKIVYDNVYYELHSADEMQNMIEMAMNWPESSVYVMGVEVVDFKLQVAPFEFFFLPYGSPTAEGREKNRQRLYRALRKFHKRNGG